MLFLHYLKNLNLFGEQKNAPEFLRKDDTPDRNEQLFLKSAPLAASDIRLGMAKLGSNALLF